MYALYIWMFMVCSNGVCWYMTYTFTYACVCTAVFLVGSGFSLFNLAGCIWFAWSAGYSASPLQSTLSLDVDVQWASSQYKPGFVSLFLASHWRSQWWWVFACRRTVVVLCCQTQLPSVQSCVVCAMLWRSTLSSDLLYMPAAFRWNQKQGL